MACVVINLFERNQESGGLFYDQFILGGDFLTVFGDDPGLKVICYTIYIFWERGFPHQTKNSDNIIGKSLILTQELYKR